MMTRLKYLWIDYWDSLNLLCKISTRKRLYLALDMLWCIPFRLTLPSEYCCYGFDFIPRYKRKDYNTLIKRKYAYKQLATPSARKITENKYYQASILRQYFNREFLHSPTMTMEDFKSFIENEEKFIYKPLCSSRGTGQRVYHLDRCRSAEELFDEIKALPGGILEQWICQHESLSNLYPDAVHIARIHTIHDGSAKDILVYGSNLSIAYKGEIANTSLNTTLSAQVDDKTGVVTTDCYDAEFNIFREIPGSNIPIKGFQLPDWDKALDLVRQSAARIPDLRLIGWDVAFTPNGPVIVEGNTMAEQVGIQSRCWVNEGLSYGVWPIVKPYLKMKPKKG